MATTLITAEDVEPFTDIDERKLAGMIAHVTARAISVAPCLATATDEQVLASAKAILLQAILRWHDTDTGIVTTQTAGVFSQTTTPLKAVAEPVVRRSGLLWPSEITDLQSLCKAGGGGAYSVDALPGHDVVHADICSLRFDPTRGCSCGAILTARAPLWENR